MKLRLLARELWIPWLVATVFSGLPSTLYAVWTGGDPLEATRAAGAMLIGEQASTASLVAAAALVHPVVSLVWAVVFSALLPRRHVALWAVAGAAMVALLDLKLIAPLAFPSVAALPFWPQFADHLMWGALLGACMQHARQRQPGSRALPRSGLG